MRIVLLVLIALLIVCSPVHLNAQIKLPAIISDNMILQQNSKVALWGWAAPGETVTITNTWNKKEVSITSDASGKWLTYISTTKAGGPYKLSFKASNTIDVTNVLLGEVWLASGQSNMEFFVGKTSNPSYTGIHNYDEIIKDAEHPYIRQIDVPNKVADTPQADFKGTWKICTAKNNRYIFGGSLFFCKRN